MQRDKIKIAASILCLTIIAACLIQALPKFTELQKMRTASNQNNAESSVAVSETVAPGSGSTVDQVDNAEYMNSQEYVENDNRIKALKERVHLLETDLISDLTDITRFMFNHITELCSKPNDETLLSECKRYMTDAFYDKFKDMKFEPTSYMVYDIKFSDLDKNDISVYVFTRGSQRYFVTFSFDKEKNYVISNIKQIKE